MGVMDNEAFYPIISRKMNHWDKLHENKNTTERVAVVTRGNKGGGYFFIQWRWLIVSSRGKLNELFYFVSIQSFM